MSDTVYIFLINLKSCFRVKTIFKMTLTLLLVDMSIMFRKRDVFLLFLTDQILYVIA